MYKKGNTAWNKGLRGRTHIDFVGKKYGKLIAVRFARKDEHNNYFWIFKCDCGNERVFIKSAVTRKNRSVKNCGCEKIVRVKNSMYGTKFYYTYHLIKQRCDNPKHPRYRTWGGRGIKCKWKSFEAFKVDMYESFLHHSNTYGGRNTSIDRINNNGHYCKDNCRWATQKEQANNRGY